jgi:peptidoglycan lytic transglycosylase
MTFWCIQFLYFALLWRPSAAHAKLLVSPPAPLAVTTQKVQTHLASWYGTKYHGRLTASGEVYDMYQLTAAHRDLPLGTRLRVTNPKNGKSVTVRINDRGPFVAGRDLDLSYAAACKLGFEHQGLAKVRWQRLDDESISG